MKNSKILKALCYILIPILLFVLIISIFYEIEIKEYNRYYSNTEYWNSDQFLFNFMNTLSSECNKLIYRNSYYGSFVNDVESGVKLIYNEGYVSDIKDFYFLIIYKDLAFTNVELTTNTDTLLEVKNFINNSEDKKASFINGNVSADSELIKTKAIQYFNNFQISYYTMQSENEDIIVYDQNYISNEEYSVEVKQNPNNHKRVDYDTTINDYEMYTSYKEDFITRRNLISPTEIKEFLDSYSFLIVPTIPICSILLLIILIYLIISIGYKKNSKEIDINDFDKVPFEILVTMYLIIVGIIIAVFLEIFDNSSSLENVNLFISLSLTIYISSYIAVMSLLVTTIKRIKSKTFVNTSIILRILKKIFNLCKKVIKKIISTINDLISAIRLSSKTIGSTNMILLMFIIVVPTLVLLPIIFRGFGIIFDCCILCYILYDLIIKVTQFKQIENYLKKIYDGEELEKLNSQKFNKCYKDVINYISNISNGYQDAIENGIKSEKLKTELITNVSHDIKTPLTSIINYVDLLKKENIKNPKALEYIDVLDNKSQRLKKLTEDLVEASKASSGNVNLDFKIINLVELLNQSIGEFEDKFKEKSLDIIFNQSQDEVFIKADSRYMYRVIENLFSNISKYALDASRVYIDLFIDGSKIKLYIKNISKERLNISAEELMQRFVRGDKSRATEGSGLGLSISQSLTELQNGKFNLKVDGDLFKVELEFNTLN